MITIFFRIVILGGPFFIAVYIDNLVMISIEKSETNKKRALEIQDKLVSDHELCLGLGQC